jgi:hypothetical protein
LHFSVELKYLFLRWHSPLGSEATCSPAVTLPVAAQKYVPVPRLAVYQQKN